MHPKEMYDEFIELLDTSDNFISGASIWRKLHAANQNIQRIISDADGTFFVQNTSISLVANQATYDLPANARLGARIVFTEGIAGSEEIPSINMFKHHVDYEASGLTQGRQYTIEGAKVRIAPVPTSAETDAVRVWYIPNFGNMLYGVASAGAASTITGWTTASNYTTNFGEIDKRDDYYNGMTIRIISGTSAGDQRIVSDFDGGTSGGLWTVNTAWTSTPDTTSVFCLESPVPEDHRMTSILNACLYGSIQTRKRMSDIRQTYFGNIQQRGALGDLLAYLEERKEQLQVVVPLDIGA